jgi:signal transduction histidine kinase
MQHFKNYKKIGRRNVFLLVLIIIISLLVTSISVVFYYSSIIDRHVTLNINEFEEPDLEHLCNITKCKGILYSDNSEIIYLNSKPNELLKKNVLEPKNNIYEDESKFIDFDPTFFVIDPPETWLEVGIYNDDTNSRFFLDMNDELNQIVFFSIVQLGVIMTVFVIMYINGVKEANVKGRVLNRTQEELSNHKILAIYTENLNHELAQPIAVLESKVSKLDITDRLSGRNKIDLMMMKQNINIVKGIMGKLKLYKQIKLTNGNKHIYSSIEDSFLSMSVNHIEFKWSINERLKEFILMHGDKYITNVTIFQVIVNLVKNSLEANGTNFKVDFQKYDEKNKKLYISFTDDGSGIPVAITDNKGLKKYILKNIFNEDFSSKNGSARGNGLAIIKMILENGGGSIDLKETSKKGTTFTIVFSAQLKKDYDERVRG